MKLGSPPEPGQLRAQSSDWVILDTDIALWRVHRSAGAHVIAWDRLRYWGPAPARFDPHEPPPRDQDIGVSYVAMDIPTALAEVFQDRRVVNTTRHAPYVTGWQPTRPLHLLDLTGTWPVRAGASHAITTGRHDLCREWARAIYLRWPATDGLYACSAMTGRPSVVLWTHAVDTFPAAPSFSRPLSHPVIRPLLRAGAREIGFRLL